MKFKIKYADQIVGLFIIVALAMLAVIVILVGVNQRWFAKDYSFWTVFSSANGVSPGTAIVMNGFTVGKIDKISLNDDNKVDVYFHIYDTYYHLVRRYSLLELTVSPIGLGSSLLFHPGTGDEPLPEGEFIATADSADGQAWIEQGLVLIPPKDDTITRLLAGVNPLLENVNKTVVTINRTLTEVNRALAGQSSGPAGAIVEDLSRGVAKIPRTMDRVDAIVADVQARTAGLLDQVSSLVLALQVVTKDVGTVTGNLALASDELADPTGLIPKLLDPKGSLKTLLDDDNALYKHIISIVEEIEAAVRSLQGIVTGLNGEMPKIAAVLNETRVAIQQAQDVLEGVKNNPLIRGGITESAEQGSLYGSMREGSFE